MAKRNTYREWEPHEIQYVRDHWRSMSDAAIGEVLNRPQLSVQRKRSRLGLKKLVPAPALVESEEAESA